MGMRSRHAGRGTACACVAAAINRSDSLQSSRLLPTIAPPPTSGRSGRHKGGVMVV